MQNAKIAKLIYRQNIPNHREIWYICLINTRQIGTKSDTIMSLGWLIC